MAEDLQVNEGVVIPAEELRWRFSRSSGPGGQGVNTADSRVELSWDVLASRALSAVQRDRVVQRIPARLVDGVITVAASTHREQLRNREAARVRLVAILRQALAPPPPQRRATRPTAGSRRRRLESKRRTGDVKRLRQRPDD